MNGKIGAFLLFIFIFIKAYTFAGHGTVRGGYYYPPSQKFKILFPLPSAGGMFSKNYYCESIKNVSGKGERVHFLINNHWKCSGYWHVMLALAAPGQEHQIPKQLSTAQNLVEHHVQYYLENSKLNSSQVVQFSGFPAYQFYYEGLSTDDHSPTGIVYTLICYSDAIAGISLIYSLNENCFSDRTTLNPKLFLEKYNQILHSFQRA